MKIKTEAPRIWDEYQKGRRYKEAIEVFENVERNENFYLGKQWEGLNAPDLPKPVLNFLKRVVTFIIATIVSDDIAISLTPHERDEEKQMIAKAIGKQCDKVIENSKFKTKLRNCVRNAAVDGDACLYWRFDPDIETGQDAKGDIVCELIENINVIFGNPYDSDVQSQPYILISQRKTVEELKDEAKERGVPEHEWSGIKADTDNYQNEKGDADILGTKLIKLWKDNGTVWCEETTEKVVLRKPFDTGYTLYPIAWMPWEDVKSSYHGQAILTGLIPNQIEVNRLFACYIRSVQMNAFPKIVYDGSKIANWNPSVGVAIKAKGSVSSIADAVTSIRGGDTSYQVMDVINQMITMTRDFMGANDAALGNVKPDNTSAIIAVQQASTMPLELQKMALYQFVEDCSRIMIDIMRQNYGVREISLENEQVIPIIDPMTGMEIGQEVITSMPYDFGQYQSLNYEFNVDVGASSYWSEMMQTKTMDNLFSMGIITDAVTYLESIPNKYIRNKDKIIEEIKEQQEMMAQQMAQQMPITEPTTPQPDQLAQEVMDSRAMVQQMAREQAAQ